MRRFIPVLAALLVLGALPSTTLASCILPNYAAFLAEPNAAIIGGRILAVTPDNVTVAAERWWGEGAAPVVTIQRPPADPNVITSVDWNPQPGEAWLIFAHQDGGSIRTEVCGQWSASPESLADVAAAAGPGVIPAEVVPTVGGADAPDTGDPGQQAAGATPALMIGLAALVAATAVVIFALVRTRRARTD